MSKRNKTILSIVALILTITALVAAIIVFKDQLCELFGKAKDFCDTKVKNLNRPDDYEFYDDVD